MADFTPGPWAVVANLSGSENHKGFYIKSKKFVLAYDVIPVDEDGNEGRANAHLIAAAPDLYAALEAALPRLAHKFECGRVKPTAEWEDGGSWDFSGCNCEIRTVKAALAAARGERHV